MVNLGCIDVNPWTARKGLPQQTLLAAVKQAFAGISLATIKKMQVMANHPSDNGTPSSDNSRLKPGAGKDTPGKDKGPDAGSIPGAEKQAANMPHSTHKKAHSDDNLSREKQEQADLEQQQKEAMSERD